MNPFYGPSVALSSEAQAVIDAFVQQDHVLPEHMENLKQTFAASPKLILMINEAVEKGFLTGIRSGRSDVNLTQTEGWYAIAGRELVVPLKPISTWPDGTFNSIRAIATLASALQQALERERSLRVLADFEDNRERVDFEARPGEPLDYTGAIRHLICGYRDVEAKAAVSVWNALVSAAWKKAMDQQLSPPTLADIYPWIPCDMDHFVDVDHSGEVPACSLKPNLRVGRYLDMEMSAENLEGMAENCFERSFLFGDQGSSNYVNFYGCAAIGAVLDHRLGGLAEPDLLRSTPGIRIDMRALHLDPELVAGNGLDLDMTFGPIYCVDMSAEPPAYVIFPDTEEAVERTCRPAMPDLEHLHHPGNGLYTDALDILRGSTILLPGENERDLAAALAVSACTEGMTAIDRLTAERGRVYATQEVTGRLFNLTAVVDRAKAVGTGFEESSRQWLEVHAGMLSVPKVVDLFGGVSQSAPCGPSLSRR